MKEKKNLIAAFAFAALSATAADVVLTGETEYAVANGKTNSVADRITGAGSILKTGDGNLTLSGSGNDFSGGVKISGGTVTASSANALGTGKVTVSDASAGVNFDVEPASSGEYVTFNNAIEFTGDAGVSYNGEDGSGDGKRNVIFFKNTRLTGDMVGTRSFRLRHNPISTGDPRNGGPSTIFDGKLDAGENDIYLNVYGTMTVNGPVTAGLLSGGEAWSGGGTLALYNPQNSIRTLVVCHNNVRCGAQNVLGGSVVMWRFTGSDAISGLSCVNMGGFDQTIAGLSQHHFNDKNWQGAYTTSTKVGIGGNTYCIMSSTPATLTITGDGMDLTTYAPLMGAASLVVDAKENKAFKQTFTRHESEFSGMTEVRAGILEIDGLARFSKTTSVSVSSGAKFLCRSTNSNPALESVKSLSVEGVFDASEASVNPFSTLDSVSLGAESEVYLPADAVLSVQSMTVAGKSQATCLLTPSTLPNLKSGRILIVGGEAKTSTWTGAASSSSLTDSGNWSAGFQDGALKAVFAESGTSATVDADAMLYEIIFRAAEGKDGFSLVRSDPAHTLTVGPRISALTNDLAATPHTYMIDNPLKVFGILTFHADTNQTLVVRNALHESVDEIGLHKIYVDGKGAGACLSGRIVFDGTNYFGGELTMSTSVVRVSGKLANPDDTYTGDPGEDGDGSSINVWLGKGGAVADKPNNYGLILSNAVVGKSMFVQNQIGKRTITTEPGTTNVFSGYLRYNDNGDPSHQGVEVSANSELTLAGGLHGSHSFRKYGSGTLRIMDIPVDCQKSAGFNPAASGRVIFEVPNNTFKYLLLGYSNLNSGGNMIVETTVDNVLTNGLVQIGGNGASADECVALSVGTYTLDVHSTTQRCQKIAVLKQGTLTGEYPAMVEIFEGWLDATDTKAADPDGYRYLGNVTGGVGLHQCGPGTLTITNAVSSCGDLIVSDGVIEFTTTGSWLNGTNVTVTGSGTLKLAQGTHFRSRTTALHLGADGDSWKIDIPAGVSHSVAALYDSEGNKLSAGVYGNASSGAANTRYASHFPNNGTLNVRRSGMAVSIR